MALFFIKSGKLRFDITYESCQAFFSLKNKKRKIKNAVHFCHFLDYCNSCLFVGKGRQLLWHFVSFPACQIPSEKGSALKGKNLRSKGAKANSFLLEKTSFQKGAKTV